MAEELTQSNPKKAALLNEYSLAIREARRTNAIENPGQDGPTDTWLSVRS